MPVVNNDKNNLAGPSRLTAEGVALTTPMEVDLRDYEGFVGATFNIAANPVLVVEERDFMMLVGYFDYAEGEYALPDNFQRVYATGPVNITIHMRLPGGQLYRFVPMLGLAAPGPIIEVRQDAAVNCTISWPPRG